ISQNIESRKNEARNHFFKMLDFHNQTVNEINISHIDTEKEYRSEGRRAFVIFKIQIKRLLELIKKLNEEEVWNLDNIQRLDIAYIVFYYGLDTTWTPFIEDKLKIYPNHNVIINKILEKIKENPKLKLGRTNQTSLSAYFRNMYNAIKLVDDNKYLKTSEKKDLIKIYRAQLSNPELYVLFFNLMSRFGKKWKERKYVTTYSFIKNIPKGYCDGYEPNDYFPMTYEDDEQ
ncbi:MAG: putative phage abortive infection protein, partial [Bacteroidales bacterium]|nr:putative phage abortive infection protein [Bacteroidales bacterium]